MGFGYVVSFAINMSAGNFIYQAFAGHDWLAATERSFFMTSAVLGCWALWKVMEST